MADLIECQNPVKRSKEIEDFVDYVCVHVGIDQQMAGMDPIRILEEVVEEVSVPVAVAGGLDAEQAAYCVSKGADIVIVGSNIVKSRAKTAKIPEKREIDEEIRSILEKVSTPNVSDAMHRAKAIPDVHPLVRGKKIVGKAVTVSTMDGDWAKSVEAIDVAEKGDVIVIKCSGDDAAVWGELATRSCINRGIAGVVIYGAVRDVDDIRAQNSGGNRGTLQVGKTAEVVEIREPSQVQFHELPYSGAHPDYCIPSSFSTQKSFIL